MDKLRMESVDMTMKNIEKIAELFPNCITETIDIELSTDKQKVYKKAVNFDILKQMLSNDIIDGGGKLMNLLGSGKRHLLLKQISRLRRLYAHVLKRALIGILPRTSILRVITLRS